MQMRILNIFHRGRSRTDGQTDRRTFTSGFLQTKLMQSLHATSECKFLQSTDKRTNKQAAILKLDARNQLCSVIFIDNQMFLKQTTIKLCVRLQIKCWFLMQFHFEAPAFNAFKLHSCST